MAHNRVHIPSPTLRLTWGRAWCSAVWRGWARGGSKGQHHHFLRVVEDLQPEDAETRAQLAERFLKLGAAWRHKEALRCWHARASWQDAAAGLDTWPSVERSGPAELVQALSSFRAWRAEILAFFAFLPILLSNGFVARANGAARRVSFQ